MRKILALLAASLLAGCSSVTDYQPYVQDVTDQGVLTKDEMICRTHALGYKPGLDLGTIATATVQGGANNLAGAAVNPAVPLLGAAGSGASATLSGLGILSNDQRKVFLKCLDHRGERSRSYSVEDPNE